MNSWFKLDVLQGAAIVEDQKVVVLGPAVETAIQRSPIYHIRNG